MTALIKVVGRKPRVSTSDGHGYSTPGKETPPLPQRNGQRMKEKEFNEAVQNYLHIELTRCGIDHLDVAPGRTDIPLKDRAKASNDFKADLHIDIHANAFDGVLNDNAGGIETFAHFGYPKTVEIAKVIHRHVMKGTKMKDRGVKNGDWLYMLQNTSAHAVLVELGFMDNKHDVEHLLSDAYRRECARELAEGICEVFGMPYIPEKPAAQAPKPSEASGVFKDVSKGHWAHDYIKHLKDVGIVVGLPDGTFRPDEPMTRAEAAKLISLAIKQFGRG